MDRILISLPGSVPESGRSAAGGRSQKGFDMGLRPIRRPASDGDAPGQPREATAPRDPAVRPPPGVSAAVWAAVPAPLRAEVLERVARDVVRCIHPESSVTRQLDERGIRVPLRSGAGPVTPIGVALHREMRMPGSPGPEAARLEATILEAIREDPVSALSHPGGLGPAAGVPERVMDGISDLVRWEAERAIANLRARRAEGDPTAAWWVDPDEWSFHLEDGDCPSAGPAR